MNTQVKIADLSTPTKAENSFNSAKTQISVQKPKIKLFNQKVKSNSMVDIFINQDSYDNHISELMEETQQTLEYYITLHHLSKVHTLNNKE